MTILTGLLKDRINNCKVMMGLGDLTGLFYHKPFYDSVGEMN